eukprot:2298344-Amphidinium_carterae.1
MEYQEIGSGGARIKALTKDIFYSVTDIQFDRSRTSRLGKNLVLRGDPCTPRGSMSQGAGVVGQNRNPSLLGRPCILCLRGMP